MARQKKRRQWGSGEINRTPTGWQIRWREGNVRRKQSGYATRDDAERVLATVMGNLARGKTGLPPDPRKLPTLGEEWPGFLERRKLAVRSADCDEYRWNGHMEDYFGHLKPTAVDTACIRRFVELELAEGANPATIRIYVSLLSSLFVDLVERGIVTANPAKGLPKSLRRMMRPTHDPRTTPFVEKLEDVRRIYLALPEPLNVAYAIGAFGGLRTGEVFALRWANVDLAQRRIHVRESVKGPTKDDDTRVVPILDALLPILKAWKLKAGTADRVIPPMRCDGEKIDKGTPGPYLRPVLEQLGLHAVAKYRDAWYAATRHTFASQWVLAGNSIEKLSVILGHWSVTQTEDYAHLRPELFSADDLSTIAIDVSPGSAAVKAIGPEMAPPRSSSAAT